MNAKVKVSNRFEETGFSSGQPQATATGIDDLLVKSMAAFREYFDHRFDALEHRFSAVDHRFDAIDHRFSALESSLRSRPDFQTIGLIGIIAAMLLGFAVLIFTVLSQA